LQNLQGEMFIESTHKQCSKNKLHYNEMILLCQIDINFTKS